MVCSIGVEDGGLLSSCIGEGSIGGGGPGIRVLWGSGGNVTVTAGS